MAVGYATKLDSHGNKEWETSVYGVNAISQTSDGGYIVGSGYMAVGYATKLDSHGNKEWETSVYGVNDIS